MSLRKLFTSLAIQSPTSPPSTIDPYINSHAGPSSQRQRKGAPTDLGMEDLLSRHLALRSQRMFEAEDAEVKGTLRVTAQSHTPNPSPTAITEFPVPPRPSTSPARSPSVGINAAREALINAGLALPDEPEGVPHLHPLANRPMQKDPLHEMTRTDKSVRTKALSKISSIMRDGRRDTQAAAVSLRRVRDRCRKHGVPFGELLEEPIEEYKQPPVTLEVLRCDFSKAPELLLFLIEHSQAKNLQMNIRRGCILRSDNCQLYETIRHLIPCTSLNPWDPPRFEYEVSIEQQASVGLSHTSPSTSTPPLSKEFRALISIPNFPKALLEDAIALAKRRSTPPEKRGDLTDALLRSEAGLVVEWIACERCWTLEIGANKLTLTLLDGDACTLDARMTVIRDERPVLPRLDIAPIPGLSLSRPKQSTAPPEVTGNYWTSSAARTSEIAKHMRTDSAESQFLVNVEPPTPQRTRPGREDSASSRQQQWPGSFYAEPQSAASLLSFAEQSSPSPGPRPPRPARALVIPHTTLHPLRSRGQHKATLSPCFPAYASTTSFVKAVLSSKELLVEFVVRLGPAELGELGTTSPRRASVGGRSFFHVENSGSDRGGRQGSGSGSMDDPFEDDEDDRKERPRLSKDYDMLRPDVKRGAPVRSTSYEY